MQYTSQSRSSCRGGIASLTWTHALLYGEDQREGRIQSAERAVPTLLHHNLTNLLSA